MATQSSSGPTPGTKLAAASFEHVAFEVDRIDHRRSWSVLVQGVGHHVTPEFGRVFERALTLAITCWGARGKGALGPGDPHGDHGRRLVATESTKG